MLKLFRMLFWLTKEEKEILKKLKSSKNLEVSEYSFSVEQRQGK